MDLTKFETEDYQNRGDDAPRPGKPVDIMVHGENKDIIHFCFKDTSKLIGGNWVNSFLKQNGLKAEKVSAWYPDDNEYEFDWLEVEAVGVNTV